MQDLPICYELRSYVNDDGYVVLEMYYGSQYNFAAKSALHDS